LCAIEHSQPTAAMFADSYSDGPKAGTSRGRQVACQDRSSLTATPGKKPELHKHEQVPNPTKFQLVPEMLQGPGAISAHPGTVAGFAERCSVVMLAQTIGWNVGTFVQITCWSMTRHMCCHNCEEYTHATRGPFATNLHPPTCNPRQNVRRRHVLCRDLHSGVPPHRCWGNPHAGPLPPFWGRRQMAEPLNPAAAPLQLAVRSLSESPWG
jgi:hypothetical protein